MLSPEGELQRETAMPSLLGSMSGAPGANNYQSPRRTMMKMPELPKLPPYALTPSEVKAYAKAYGELVREACEAGNTSRQDRLCGSNGTVDCQNTSESERCGDCGRCS